jgi:sporadic carbohydrate cluster protein (TIGR04323 family)
MSQKLNKNWYMGYIFSREIDDNIIPQKVQNLVIRDYAQRFNMNLILSSTEYKIKNSFLILDSLIAKKTNKYKGIIIYSLFMLKNYSKLNKILEKVKKNNIRLFCALEEIEISNNSDLNSLKKIFFINKIKKNDVKKK